MRTVRPLIAGAAASAATLAVLGLTATAQAQPASLTAVTHTYSVPLGVETAVNLTGCASGTTVGSVTPAPPVTAHVVINGNKVKLAGDWLATGATTYTVHCTNGTKTTNKLTVLAAPAGERCRRRRLGHHPERAGPVQRRLQRHASRARPPPASTAGTPPTPTPGRSATPIAEKSGCSSIARPDGSSAGITQLATFQKTGDGNFYCSSFARSSRARGSSDPAFAPGGIAFVDLAGDAVTWSAQATTNAPATLTTAQLAAIYNCTDTNWSQVGGKNAPIHAFIPQSSSGTRSFFLGAIGIATPGSCVSDDGGTLEENEGVNPVLKDPDAIFPYSIGKYIAEKFHSTTCNNSACTPDSNGNVCTPAAGKNLFGCNTHGTMVLKQINGVAPTTGTGTGTVINSSFPATFQRTVFEVVPYDPATSDHIPGATSPVGGVNLEAIFGASGFVCTNSTAKADLKNYGFLVTPLCGVTG